MKTAELIDQYLDWAVGKCLGLEAHLYVETNGLLCYQSRVWNPSTNGHLAVPIIDKEEISTFVYNRINPLDPDKWCAHIMVPRPNMEGGFNMTAFTLDGPTMLIAAMRCFVSAKMGYDIDIPEMNTLRLHV